MQRLPTRWSLNVLTLAGVLVAAWACESLTGDPPPPPPPPPTPSALVAVSGGGQTDTVAQQLADPVVAQVNDQNGSPMSGITVTFAVTQGNGSVGSPSATTDANGQASSTWTLGSGAGNQQVTATVGGVSGGATFAATAVPDAPDTIAAVSGDGQFGFQDTKLLDPIVVDVRDRYGNTVSGVSVAFSVTAGGGALDSVSATTDAGGAARTGWTLGSLIGANTAQASVAGLKGDPVVFNATATNLSITSISPDPIVEGGTATLTGTGFNLTPGNNAVTVDGVPATVTAVASQTSMTITVPSFNCLPERDVNVQVTVGAVTHAPFSHHLEPVSQLALAVGEQTIVTDPASFCLQFAASASGGDAYLVGIGAAAETPGGTMPFSLTAVSGSATPAPPTLPFPSAAARQPVPIDPTYLAVQRMQAQAESRIREYERQLFERNPNLSTEFPDARVMGVPGAAPVAATAVGDTLTFRVPSTCTDYTEITTVVRNVGKNGIWVTDIANPTADSLTQADIDAASTLFDDFIFPFDTTFFGAPTDLDANASIIVVLTEEVNKAGAAGFVNSADLLPPASCAASDEGEIFYGFVPDGTYSRQFVVDFLPVLITHEFTHNIQVSRRTLLLPGGSFPSRWIAEGQATFAEEVVGHAALGNAPGQNYGAAEAFDGPPYWYRPALYKLGQYFGGNAAKIGAAPEDCSLFADFNADYGACVWDHFYGSTWSFLRYVSDRFYAGNESQFQKDLISAYPGLNGVANFENVTGRTFETVFAEWGAMLYVDERVPGAPAALQMTSWDLPDALSSIAASSQLEPLMRSFGDFSDARSVRGGSHDYVHVSAAGARPAVAIRVRDNTDAPLGTALTPILWIVRIQ